jgi:hypothetical protein
MTFERFSAGKAIMAATVALASARAEAGLPREFTLHRPSTTQFFMDYNDGDGAPNRIFALGASSDTAWLADVDGDTLADLILFRQGTWFVDLRNDGVIDRIFFLGGAGDVPVVGDFLGTGRAGFGVYRPSNGLWYLDRDGDGSIDHISAWGGAPGDIPVVADYDGDGRADRAIYRDGTWFVDLGFDGTLDAVYYLGGDPQDIPLAADFDGDWKADNAVFRDGVWYIDYGNDGTVDRVLSYGAPGDRPLFAPVNPTSSLFVRAGAVGGDGSQAAPFGTIAAGLAVAAPGNILRIAAGTYNEGVCFSGRQNLTFVGAGVSATNLVGTNNNACDNTRDGFVAVASQGIVVRNLHVAVPATSCAVTPATECNRAIVAQGTGLGVTTLTLDRVSTIGNRSHGVVAAGTSGTPSTLLVQSSNLDRSQIGNGLRLGGGVSATVQRSSIDRNGTVLPVASDMGRGVESFLDSTLLIEFSSSSDNYHSALLFTGSSQGTVRYNVLNRNGHAAVFFEQATRGDVYGNLMDTNGILGTPGPTTGFNAVEVFTNWTGPQMLIHENSIYRATTGGIFVGHGPVTVANNYLFDNFIGLTIFDTTNVGVFGNTFELPLAQGNEEGLFMQGPGLVATVGGAGVNKNTFINYIDNPAIHCNGTGEAATCPSGGNTFQNCNLPIIGCPMTCQP